MLLKALYDHAVKKRLLDTVHLQERRIDFLIPIDLDGILLSDSLLSQTSKNKKGKDVLGRLLPMPRFPGENNGGRAYFLAESFTYIFGIDVGTGTGVKLSGPKLNNHAKSFLHFWERIENAQASNPSPELQALIRFKDRYLYQENGVARHRVTFVKWNQPTRENEKPKLCVVTASGELIPVEKRTLTFQINGNLVFQADPSHSLYSYWRAQYRKEAFSEETVATASSCASDSGVCLLTGVVGRPIARSHKPKVLGVPGLTSGGYIVSFARECPAFSSYGLHMGQNAPVCEEAAASYALALQTLISSNDHSARIGPLVACFWSSEDSAGSEFIARMLNKPDPLLVKHFLKSPWTGISRANSRLESFFCATFSANAGRVVVRDWLQASLAESRQNLWKWFDDLTVVEIDGSAAAHTPQAGEKRSKPGPQDDNGEALPCLALYKLAGSTVRDPSKELRAEVLSRFFRAALDGAPLPISVLTSVMSRLRSDMARFGNGILKTPLPGKLVQAMRASGHPISPPGKSRFALLKLILRRTAKEGVPMIEPKIFTTEDAAYNCGRLLAVLADAQATAHEYKLEGAGVAERYFGSASVTPALVFPLLLRLNRHHLDKIRRSDSRRSHAGFIEDSIQSILSLFSPVQQGGPPEFPRLLDLHAQGRFAMGFYQQKAASDAARHSQKKKPVNQHYEEEAKP